MNKCTKKTIGDIVMMTAIALMILVTGLGVYETAHADNVDRIWYFDLKNSSSNWKHFNREKKDDTTKHYINWFTSYNGNVTQLKISPYGTRNLADSPKAAGDAYGNTKYYIIKSIGKYRVTNFVKELGYRYATPKVRSVKGAGTVKGYWSPDSVGSYPIL